MSPPSPTKIVDRTVVSRRGGRHSTDNDDDDDQPLQPPSREPCLDVSASSAPSEEKEEHVVEASQYQHIAQPSTSSSSNNAQGMSSAPSPTKQHGKVPSPTTPGATSPGAVSIPGIACQSTDRNASASAPPTPRAIMDQRTGITTSDAKENVVATDVSGVVRSGDRVKRSKEDRHKLAILDSNQVSSQFHEVGQTATARMVSVDDDSKMIQQEEGETSGAPGESDSPPSAEAPEEAPEDAIIAQLVPDEDELAERLQRQLEQRLQHEIKEQWENERKRHVTVNAVAIDSEEKSIDPESLAVTHGIGGESGCSRRTLCVILIGFVFLVGGIATGAALAVGGDNGSEMPPTPSPTSYPSQTQTSYPSQTPEFNEMLDRIGKDISDNMDMLNDPDTVQHKALDWLANKDNWSSNISRSTQALVERYALAVFYFSTQGKAGWTVPYAFLESSSVCQWRDLNAAELRGVICDENDVYVEQLHLVNVTAQGQIPTELALLSSLESLWLEDHTLSGEIPTQLFQMIKLTSLALQNTELKGAIPESISELTNLELLSLSTSSFSGSIPTTLSKLTKLETLGLYENNLNGTIPTELGFITSLQYLYLHENQFQGTLPTELGNMTNLVHLFLNGKNLRGTIPNEFGALTEMINFQVQGNELSGTIPTALGLWTSLKYLWLSENQFKGTLPTELGRLVDLEELRVYDNQLLGAVPIEFANLPQLKRVYLHKNKFAGSVNATFCADDRELPLEDLYADCSELVCPCCTMCCDEFGCLPQ